MRTQMFIRIDDVQIMMPIDIASNWGMTVNRQSLRRVWRYQRGKIVPGYNK
jgi:hypothetical protein